MSREYAVALGARLRAVRRQHGMTLQQVHQRSGKRWSAVVLGSYERADRAMSVTTLADLASFYGVPTADLLPTEPAPAQAHHADRKLTIDLHRIPTLPTRLAGPLARHTAAIQHQRHSHTGAALTIRDQDLQALAVMYDTTPTPLPRHSPTGEYSPQARPISAGKGPHHRSMPRARRRSARAITDRRRRAMPTSWIDG